MFRAAEEQAVGRGVREQPDAGPASEAATAEQIDAETLRERLVEAIRRGDEAAMRDLARLAIAASGGAPRGRACSAWTCSGSGVRSTCAPTWAARCARTPPGCR